MKQLNQNNLLLLAWKGRHLIKLNKEIKTKALTVYILNNNNYISLFQKKENYLLRMSALVEAAKNHYNTINVYLYFYPGKNAIIFPGFKIRTFILISNLCKDLIIIKWQCRIIVIYIITLYLYLTKYIYIITALSLHFKKYYLQIISYLAYEYHLLTKSDISFEYTKERTYIEYQVCFSSYKGLSFHLINHFKQHVIKMLPLISSVRLDIIAFVPNNQVPRRIPLGFISLGIQLILYDELVSKISFHALHDINPILSLTMLTITSFYKF